MQQLTLKNNQVVNIDNANQMILINYVSNLIAWNRIDPIYYQGLSAGSEFLTYNAGKLYIALEVKVGCNATGVDVTNGNFITLDENNVANFRTTNLSPMYNTTVPAEKYENNLLIMKNLYFSRVQLVFYDYFSFVGYRLTV